MKKGIILLTLGILLLNGSLFAQTHMQVPHGSFEQWTPQQGYSVSFMGLSLPIFDTFSTPTGWNYLAYPVNETFSFVGLSININTQVPLVVASPVTGVVPDSLKAVKLQSFMLEDIINSAVYPLVEANLDTMLTQTVLPTVLATGSVDLDAFIPIVTNLLSNMDSVEQMLASLALMDVNQLITGGIALNGFEPTRLTGSYKYHSATSGDNGAVLMLGTHYNTVTHQRDVVGGGANIALTDIANFTPFSVDYVSLHSIQSTFPEQAPDSLIVILLSSAGASMQQGSYLCLDKLELWHDTVPVVEPDTCASVVAMVSPPDIHEAVLNWNSTGVVYGYELEYGIAGFTQGSGMSMTLISNTVTLTGLAANTLYDVYIRSFCSDSIYSDWALLQFRTNPDTCASIVSWVATPGIHKAQLAWSASSEVNGYELEYGLAGFTQGTGTRMSLANDTVTLTDLTADTLYDVYLRTLCNDSVYGNWAIRHFHTKIDTCARARHLSIQIMDQGMALLTWNSSFFPDHWEMEYGRHGFELGTGTLVAIPYAMVDLLSMLGDAFDYSTWYDIYIRSVCEDGIYGKWDSVHYRTFCPRASSIGMRSDSLSATSDGLVSGYQVFWADTLNVVDSWIVEYRENYSAMTVDTVYDTVFNMPPLKPSTRYTVRVSSICGDTNRSNKFVTVEFVTDPLPVGIDQTDAFALTVSPNPAHGQCEVTVPGNDLVELKLYSLDGRLLQTVTAIGSSTVLRLPAQGVFLLQATTASGTVTRKIVNK